LILTAHKPTQRSEMINIDDLTLGQIKEIKAMLRGVLE
jgi:hypothetical protein